MGFMSYDRKYKQTDKQKLQLNMYKYIEKNGRYIDIDWKHMKRKFIQSYVEYF